MGSLRDYICRRIRTVALDIVCFALDPRLLAPRPRAVASTAVRMDRSKFSGDNDRWFVEQNSVPPGATNGSAVAASSS